MGYYYEKDYSGQSGLGDDEPLVTVPKVASRARTLRPDYNWPRRNRQNFYATRMGAEAMPKPVPSIYSTVAGSMWQPASVNATLPPGFYRKDRVGSVSQSVVARSSSPIGSVRSHGLAGLGGYDGMGAFDGSLSSIPFNPASVADLNDLKAMKNLMASTPTVTSTSREARSFGDKSTQTIPWVPKYLNGVVVNAQDRYDWVLAANDVIAARMLAAKRATAAGQAALLQKTTLALTPTGRIVSTETDPTATRLSSMAASDIIAARVAAGMSADNPPPGSAFVSAAPSYGSASNNGTLISFGQGGAITITPTDTTQRVPSEVLAAKKKAAAAASGAGGSASKSDSSHYEEGLLPSPDVQVSATISDSTKWLIAGALGVGAYLLYKASKKGH